MSQKEKNKTRFLQHHVYEINAISKNPIPFFTRLIKKYGNVVNAYFLSRFYLTDDPEVIRHIFQKNNRNYVKTKRIIGAVRLQIGNGLLTSEGKYWLKQRRAIQPGFHRERLDNISKIMVEEINRYMTEELDKHAASKEAFFMDKEMMHLAYRLVSKSLFGSEAEDEKLKIIDEVITEGQEFTVYTIRKPYIKPWLLISGAYKRNQKRKKVADDLIMEIINERKNSGEKRDDLLQMLLETEYEDGTKMTDQQLLDECMVLYVAGHETTALALTWAWYLISTHPKIDGQLQAATQSVLENRDPGFSDLRSLSYASQIIDETMRMYPPAWLLDRSAVNDDEIGGYTIKKNRDIFVFVYGMHHNAKYWNDPEVFDPERFSAENKKNHVPYSYLPFGGGPRLCIGNNFALMEMQLILSMFTKRYRFEVIPEHKVEMNPMITLRPRYGIKMKVHKR